MVRHDFFLGSTEEVAKRLLGSILIRETDQGLVSGRIVETEAYLFADDPASHSRMGQTNRNRAMFQEPGTVYVYLIYGLHYCLNVVTAPIGQGEAVLIRSLEPLDGLEIMQQRRGKTEISELCSGPAKLSRALAVGPELNGTRLGTSGLSLEEGSRLKEAQIGKSVRIGVREPIPKALRFFDKESRFLSRPQKNS